MTEFLKDSRWLKAVGAKPTLLSFLVTENKKKDFLLQYICLQILVKAFKMVFQIIKFSLHSLLSCKSSIRKYYFISLDYFIVWTRTETFPLPTMTTTIVVHALSREFYWLLNEPSLDRSISTSSNWLRAEIKCSKNLIKYNHLRSKTVFCLMFYLSIDNCLLRKLLNY